MSPPPGISCGGMNGVPRLGVSDCPGFPNSEGVVPGVDGAPNRGVFDDSDIVFVGGGPKENGCILVKSGFLCCGSDVFH
jgi:hypothetical protein